MHDWRMSKIREAFRTYLRLVNPPTNECRWCHTAISTGNPEHPFCSEACKTADWQNQQW